MLLSSKQAALFGISRDLDIDFHARQLHREAREFCLETVRSPQGLVELLNTQFCRPCSNRSCLVKQVCCINAEVNTMRGSLTAQFLADFRPYVNNEVHF